MPQKSTLPRRKFLKNSLLTAAGAALGAAALQSCANHKLTLKAAPQQLLKTDPIPVVKIGFVGVGHQGTSHVRNFLNIEGVEIKAICDIRPERVEAVQKMIVEAGKSKTTGYSKGDYDFVRMCEQEDLDLVFTATPWRWHVPVCVAAMKNGKHAATEVPAALNLDECWELVETAEKYQKHCVMMENCNYDYTEMLIWNMVKQGMLGELLHAECGYLHDLRELKLSDFYQGRWRIFHSIKRNADLYPTHGLGPVAQWMNINRGNRFEYLVSMSSQSRGLNLYAAVKFGPDSPEAKQKYPLGDVVTSMIKTHQGQTIIVQHNTDSPRPYSRKIMLQGTKGLVRKYPEEKIHIEGISPQHRWQDLKEFYEQYEHPLWKRLRKKSEGAGHGGMDYIEDFRLVEALQKGQPTDMNVYDAATLSAVIALSEKSIANKSRPVDFPDFTRGQWKNWPELEIS